MCRVWLVVVSFPDRTSGSGRETWSRDLAERAPPPTTLIINHLPDTIRQLNADSALRNLVSSVSIDAYGLRCLTTNET